MGTNEQLIWLDELELGLGLWQGNFEGIPGDWLRWCDRAGNGFLADTEQERQAKEQAYQKAEKLAAKLRELGIDPDQV
ncbi:MAG: hypothetical protein AAFW84_07750 [Cyanobacteria bacterium J06635_15]